jgi:transcriptional regulator
MYQPPHFEEKRLEVIHALIRAHPLGLLISAGPEGLLADPLPFLLDAEIGAKGRLRAHLAKANPQCRLLADNPDMPVLAVFQGVDTYVTPSWYQTKQETGKVVPTWNYAIVQARGRARVIDDRDWLAAQITELTAAHEASRDQPWKVTDAPEAFIGAQIKGIVGLKVEISDITGKWKVSQNRPIEDRIGVANGLDGGNADEMAALVRSYGGLEDNNH